jgi:hypothetical protein
MTSSSWLETSPRRINRLIEELGYTSYLEIGVDKGSTFQAIKAAEKTGVDPLFQFEWETAIKPGTHLYQQTSDEFFSLQPRGSSYDFIFLDGLHTYDQTYRDLINALACAHESSLILIDDTIPNDVFSCSRDQAEAIELRKRYAQSANAAWHGDVYKLLPLIILFHPDLSYCTFTGDGNPQTLLWRNRNKQEDLSYETMQAFWAVEQLSSCDYLWFLRNQNLYHLTDEDTGIRAAVGQIKGSHRDALG